MSDIPLSPRVVGGPSVEVKRQEVESLDCPNCRKPINVTNLNFGTNIECPSCKNITWRPAFNHKWWFKLKNFLVSCFVSFLVGIFSSVAANHLDIIDISKNVDKETEIEKERVINNGH